MKNSNGVNRESLRYLLITTVNFVLAFALYQSLLFVGERTGETFYSFLVMLLYSALLVGFALAYLIYNRFLSRRGVSAEQLPSEWSAEEKTAFIEDGKRREKRSKWMITIILPLVLTFLFDAVDLFIIDTIFR